MACELRSPVRVPLRRRQIVFLIPYGVRGLANADEEIHRGQRDDERRGGEDADPFWQGHSRSPFDRRRS